MRECEGAQRSGGLVAGGGRSSGGRRGEREGGQESRVLCVLILSAQLGWRSAQTGWG